MSNAFGLSVTGGKKKRIRAFRPTLKKSVATEEAQPLSNEDPTEPPTAEPDGTADESPASDTAANENPSTTHNTSVSAASSSISRVVAPLRNRKRKSTVLAVGLSRSGASATSSSVSNALVVHDSAVADTVGAETNVLPDAVSDHPTPEENLKPSATNLPLALIPPVIPEDTSGNPKLGTFCTSFPKPKKPRTARRDRPVAVAHVAVAVAAVAATAAPEADAAPHAGPIVQIVNGEIVLQESSVIFHGSGAAATTAAALTEAALTDGALTEVVEEEAELAVVGATYTSFATGRRARPRTSHWSAPETQLFYEALRQVGLDFGTMEAFFDNHAASSPQIRKRLRRQLKNKYQAENVKNPALVEKALRCEGRVEIDLSVFELTPDAVAEVQANKKKQREQQSSATEDVVGTAAAHEARDDVGDETDVADKDETLAPATNTNENEPFSWPDEVGGEDGNDTNQMHATHAEGMEDPSMAFDPLFHEDNVADHGTTGGEVLPTLVFGVPKATKKTNKPNFRSAARKRGLGK